MERVPTTNTSTSDREGIEMEGEDMNIEKRGPMHVDTVAGPFTVRL